MSRLLRADLDELDAYVTRIAEATGIPASHVEKDYWVTEVLRGASAASREIGCSVVFKGGTSLSKAHHLIQRFSEDIDLIAVLPAGGTKAKDTALKAFVGGAAAATGIEPESDPGTTTKGVKRTSIFRFPSAHDSGALRSGVLMELGTRGGALPQRRLAVQSLIVEHAESIGMPIDFDEAEPFSILVLDPVRTLVDKLVLLHHAATEGDDVRKEATARHYYDITDCCATTTCLLSFASLRSTSSHGRCVNTRVLQNCRPPTAREAASPRVRPGTQQSLA